MNTVPDNCTFASGYDGTEPPFSRTIIAASDIHLEGEEPVGWRNRLRYGIIPDYLWEYAEAFDARELWIGGDIGDEVADVEAIARYGFDRTKIAVATDTEEHDWTEDDGDTRWYRKLVADEALQAELEQAGVEYGPKISSVIPGDDPYLVQMAHFPAAFDIDWNTTEDGGLGRDHQLDQPRVVMYGHAHVPRADVVRNSVVIGLGSSFSNYDNSGEHPWRDAPDRSLYAISFGEQHVETHLIDLEADTVVDRKRFTLGDDGFEALTDETGNKEEIPAKVAATAPERQ